MDDCVFVELYLRVYVSACTGGGVIYVGLWMFVCLSIIVCIPMSMIICSWQSPYISVHVLDLVLMYVSFCLCVCLCVSVAVCKDLCELYIWKCMCLCACVKVYVLCVPIKSWHKGFSKVKLVLNSPFSPSDLKAAIEEILPSLQEKGIRVYYLSAESPTQGVEALQGQIESASAEPLPVDLRAKVTEKSTSVYIYTSGTTGEEKCVARIFHIWICVHS